MDNIVKGEPEYMRIIREEVEREMAEERETAVREVDRYHLHRAQGGGTPRWDRVVVAQNLAIMHEDMIMSVGVIDEEIYTLLYLSTIADACLIRTDEQTGEYKSALIILADLDGVVVLADTEDASIMAGVDGRLAAHVGLPYADLIQRYIKKYYDAARSVRNLETITAPTGDSAKVLFANRF